MKHKTETKSKLDTVLIKLATSLVLGIFQAWIDTTVFETATFLGFFFFFLTGKDWYRGEKMVKYTLKECLSRIYL